MSKKPPDWKFSNYSEWAGIRSGTLVDHDFVRACFSTSREYIEFVQDYAVTKEFGEKLERYYLD